VNVTSHALLGIFVGGRGRRMGGVQKALLPAPDGSPSLLARTLRVAREVGLEPVLVGEAALGDAAQGVVQLADSEPGVGPLAGLAALLAHAGARSVIAVGGDMPYVSGAVLLRLLQEEPSAQVLAPRDAQTGKWQPLFARYDAATVSAVLTQALRAGERSFQQLFRHLTVRELVLEASEALTLRDWDTPEDVP
jgi:molybdopterin-guanine dinucleotide biosynthesis protein A